MRSYIVLKTLPVSYDGIHVETFEPPAVAPIPADAVEGLTKEGYIGQEVAPPRLPGKQGDKAGGDIAATDGPPAADAAPAEPARPTADADQDGIPDDWEGKPWFTIQKLFEQAFGAKPKSKAEAKRILDKNRRA